MYSSSPKRPAATGMSRALFQSMTCTSWSASSVRTVAAQRREVPGDGPDEQDLRLVHHLRLGEVQDGGERRRDRGSDVDRGHPAVDHHGFDAPVGTDVGGTGRGDDLTGGPEATRAGETGQRRREGLGERATRPMRPCPAPSVAAARHAL